MTGGTLLGVALAVGGAATPFVILAIRGRALRNRVPAHRQPTDEEIQAVRRRGRTSVLLFIGFWVVALGLIAVAVLAPLATSGQWAILAIVIGCAIFCIGYQLAIRCPICAYRLGYQRTLSVPDRCERCGAGLR